MKHNTRRELLVRRRSLSAKTATLNSRHICEHLSHYLHQCHPKSVAIYLAFGNEINIDALITQHPDIAFFAPICQPDFTMKWGKIDSLTSLQKNHHGILEPSDKNAVIDQEFDVMLIPLVGFDKQGQRIGMGAGYYDRALQLRQGSLLTTIGCAHGIQEIDTVPTDPWDKPMDAIATESGINWLKNQQSPLCE